VHNFENNVWLYRHDVLMQIKEDIENTIKQSIFMNRENMKDNLLQCFVRALVKALSPLM